MTDLYQCPVGSFVCVYTDPLIGLAEFKSKTNSHIRTTFLGKYINFGDNHLIGWREKPTVLIDRLIYSAPNVFLCAPQVPNPKEYKFFRWAGGARIVKAVDDIDNGLTNPVSAGLKPFELSAKHVPGWHECKCGFRNQDISESAFIAGKYVCFSCRNIWKK